MAGMQQQLHAVITGQREMARRHDGGELSYRIDASAFPGEYGLMVQETNALVGSHVQTLHDVLDVVQQYAVGDLSRDIARYPGEKAAMTTTVDTVKANPTASTPRSSSWPAPLLPATSAAEAMRSASTTISA